MESSEVVSDSELEFGCPSTDSSDEDLPAELVSPGVRVAQFCNKLREQTRPLLSLSQGVPSPTKQLRDGNNDKLKESKAKKRLFRGRQEPPNGLIERRYGYIPNPRWPKAPNSYSKPYEPKGVDSMDSERIPGVVFRDKQKSKFNESDINHSYHEHDFPQLNIIKSTARPDISACSNSSVIEISEDASIDHPKQQGPNSQLYDVYSPKTSTPIREAHNHSNTPCSVPRAGDASAFVSHSQNSFPDCRTSKHQHNADLNSSNNKGLKPLPPSPLTEHSVSSSDSSQNNSHYTSKHDSSASFQTTQANSSAEKFLSNSNGEPVWPRIESERKKVTHLFSQCDIHHNQNWPVKHNFTQDAPNSVDKFSQVKRVSLDSRHQNVENKNHKYQPASEVNLNGNSQNSFSTSKPKFISSSSSWSDVARISPSSGLQTSPVNAGGCTTKPPSADKQDAYIEGKDKAQCNKGSHGKGSKGKHRKAKTSEWPNKTQPTLSNRSAHTLTLESFMTPQRNSTKKSGLANGRKAIQMLENRFVEQIEANATSPPKKVKPSPIKRLSFSKDELSGKQHEMCNSGDARNVLLSNDSKELTIAKNNTVNLVDSSTVKAESKVNNIHHRSSHQTSKRAPVLSLESLLKKAVTEKDIFEDENEDEDEYTSNRTNEEAEKFWKVNPISDGSAPTIRSEKQITIPVESDEEDETVDILLNSCVKVTKSEKQCVVEHGTAADPLKITHKKMLKKYARRYCHYIEEHQVPNLAVELYFITQLLTCASVDSEVLHIVESHIGKTYFDSIHNGVYFAVTVIKRLKRIFLSLDGTFLQLLASNERIQAFSPKLHNYFQKASENRNKESTVKLHIEHKAFNPQEDGNFSFPDANFAHVFKCQRDNFYAFYRHYHDTSSIYEFKIENQIQYVYDGCTPEQNSLVNLFHLAKLYLDHMILCCVKNGGEKVDIIKMIQSKAENEKLFQTLYNAFLETSNASSGNACPAPGFTDTQMFFKDFIETLSCPAFNEHLKNLVVYKILELNAMDFSCVTNLHSSAIIDSDMPLRSQNFSETVLTLCVLGKLLGYLTFASYNSGTLNIPQEQSFILLRMREMVPLPVPFPLLLKCAFENGHLSLSIPWMVEYLSMMDYMAPQLTVYKSLLKKMHFVQRYAWQHLYKAGHQNTGLLIVSCISWLFESPSVPAGFFFSLESTDVELANWHHCTKKFQIDQQKLVSQSLLSSCCPYLEQGKVLLTQFALKQSPTTTVRSVLPLTPLAEVSKAPVTKATLNISQIEEWLGSSLVISADPSSVTDLSKPGSVIDDEIVPAYVLTHLLASKDADDLEDLEANLMQNNPYWKSCINTTIDLMTAKLAEYTHRMILRLLLFKAKSEIRMQFIGVAQGVNADVVKSNIVAQSNIIANSFAENARTSFYEMVENCCTKEIPALINFLMYGLEEEIRETIVHLCEKMLLKRMQEWSKVQLTPVLFQRVIVREAEKCARSNPKNLTLYPSDYSKKVEELSSSSLDTAFVECEQLSELIDKALSYGVWYINALTPGTRPDDSHMIHLIQDFTACVEERMITMDFAFYVMSNFLMNLIIQYIVDAPQNWTDSAAEAFIQLCHLCKNKKHENDKLSIKLAEFVRKKKRMKIKVLNLMSVHSIQWLTKSDAQNETLMAYTKLLVLLVKSELLHVETVFHKLLHSRDNKNLDLSTKLLVNKVLVKVLELLWSAGDSQSSFTQDRILKLVQEFPLPENRESWDKVTSDIASQFKSTFGQLVK
ncbi:uncharacterized protein LOC131945185 [Physella acuta]|uniref:uncharacterized protein LOC131945185 n=1 Tax=Physella acuta TaxID=109671 RepID=UPI0027DBC801|nr:uncharacterized protein LOC131945185 [Physella acuta]